MKPLIVFVFSAVLFIGCKQGSDETHDEDTALLTLNFADEQFRGNETIHEGDTLAAEMSFRYPVFSGGDEQVTNRINTYIFSLTQDNYFGEEEETKKQTPEALSVVAERFFKEAKESEVEGYPHTSAWSYELNTDTLMLDMTTKRLTLIHNYYTYTGGAHPNYSIQISNIDLNTGDTLSHASLFDKDQRLLAAVNKRFIENEKEISGENGMDFDMGNYWFGEGFKLPMAMGFTRDGIRCIYSPYEVAPYSRGAIDFTVPYADVPHFKK